MGQRVASENFHYFSDGNQKISITTKKGLSYFLAGSCQQLFKSMWHRPLLRQLKNFSQHLRN
jgi:hypothetical protein